LYELTSKLLVDTRSTTMALLSQYLAARTTILVVEMELTLFGTAKVQNLQFFDPSLSSLIPPPYNKSEERCEFFVVNKTDCYCIVTTPFGLFPVPIILRGLN